MGAERLRGSTLGSRRGFSGLTQAGIVEHPQGDFDRATRFPLLGRPTYRVLFGDVGLGTHPTRQIPNSDSVRKLPGNHSSTRQHGDAPISVEMREAGAPISPQNERRLLNGQGEMECPRKVRKTERKIAGTSNS